ncbi:MAG TPA: hypothetical protein VIX11_08330 [Candidatus Acidoferrum sp.]
MSGMLQPIEFYEVDVRFLSTEKGGRTAPLLPYAEGGFGGYRPNFRILGTEAFHGSAFAYVPHHINPGDEATVEMVFWCCDRKHADFVAGNEFELFEGPHKVAHGTILSKGIKECVLPLTIPQKTREVDLGGQAK